MRLYRLSGWGSGDTDGVMLVQVRYRGLMGRIDQLPATFLDLETSPVSTYLPRVNYSHDDLSSTPAALLLADRFYALLQCPLTINHRPQDPVPPSEQ